MKKGSQTINSFNGLKFLLNNFENYDFKTPLVFSWEKYSKKRSLSQNALSHKWYAIIEEAMGEEKGYAHRYCKLCFGVPMKRGFDPVFCKIYDKAIKENLTFKEKLELMDEFKMTSKFSTDQMTEYLNSVQIFFAEQGIVLNSAGEFEELQRAA